MMRYTNRHVLYFTVCGFMCGNSTSSGLHVSQVDIYNWLPDSR